MKSLFIALITILTVSCGSNEPKPINLNTDTCDFCKMTIANGKFGAELITQKGRYYKFDDVSCMIQFSKSSVVPTQFYFVCDYVKDNNLIPAESSFFVKGGTINSPMRGNCAAFSSEIIQKEYQKLLQAEPMTWKQVFNSYQ
jgi:copper chaperone NosL